MNFQLVIEIPTLEIKEHDEEANVPQQRECAR